MFSLGRFHYPNPVIILAPMAGISDQPFRQICEQQGADFSVAEMISAKPDLMDTRLAQTRLYFGDNPKKPKIVQLVGSDAKLMAQAAQLMQARGADVIDINMGCPSKSVGKHLAGSALLSDEKKVAEILTAVSKAVNIPITLKTRIGPHEEHINIHNIAKIAQDSNIALLSVHGRTRAQKFRGQARYEAIANAKQHVNIPVIVNGDITSAKQCQHLIQTYHFDGVMIGRAAQGNPWLFADCQHLLNNLPKPNHYTHRQTTITQHIQALHQLYGKQALYIARKHLHWYYQHNQDYPYWRPLINQASSDNAQIELINRLQPPIKERLP